MKKIIHYKDLPKSWDQVTFLQCLELTKVKDTADMLSVFLKTPAEEIRNAHIPDLNKILKVLAFTNEKPPEILPRKINGWTVPFDLNFKSICRYEDLKILVQQCFPKEGEEVTGKNIENYYKMVAIYAMPNYENASLADREQFSKQFLRSPCGEVLAIGNFTLKKFQGLRTPELNRFPKVAILIHRLRLALKGWLARLAFTLRFYLWKKRHGIKGMSS